LAIQQSLKILQINTNDSSGGATVVAWNLLQAYRDLGHQSWLMVGHKQSNDTDVFTIPNSNTAKGISRFWWHIYNQLLSLTSPLYGPVLRRLVHSLAEPKSFLDTFRGIENFWFPGTWHLLDSLPHKPNILHAHNLHHNYFDLRALPQLSHQIPLMLTLHDAWLLSGHCAHSFACERWRTGCGKCPDLTIYPAILRDATAYNWQRKQDIYAHSKLYIATPSHWLMKKVEQSILTSAIVDSKVIPNGIDLTIFQPTNKQSARSKLNLPLNAKIILFVASGIRQNIWKDYQTMRSAIMLVAERMNDHPIHFIALGEESPPERIGQAMIEFVPYQQDPKIVASYYQAADLYLHAAKVDTFPNVVLEALACGTPVVATAVGGIPEQVKSLTIYDKEQATGILVNQGDATALADGIEHLIRDETFTLLLAENAIKDTRQRFDLKIQVNQYLNWYQEIIGR